MRQLAVVSLILLAAVTDVAANGRPPNTSTINFKQGNEQEIAAGMTFGLLLSHDGGATWHWMCEKTVGYGGMYDPDYVYTPAGSLFATTFDGLKKMTNGCTFDATPPGTDFVSTTTLGPDGAVYYAAADPPDLMTSDPGDSNIYKSVNDGATFPTTAMPGMINDWWQSLEVAPSDPLRVYLTGYRLNGSTKTFLMFKSANGGTSYTAMSQTGIVTATNSTIEIAGISKIDPQELYIRVTLENNNIGDGIYRSINGGASWTHILSKDAGIAFVVRSNGDLVAGTQTVGSFVSHDKGATWVPLTGAPHINCLVENAAHEVWACTQNFGSPGVPPDDAGIMKTTDLATWTKVLRYQDIQGPVECAAGTAQHDDCLPMWCGLKNLLGITADPTSCPPMTTGDDTVGGDGTGTKDPKGCCDASGEGGPTALAISSLVGMVLLRTRRRRAA